MKNIGSLTISELKEKFQKAQSSLVKLKMEKATAKLKNSRAIKMKRKEIAQILTIIRQKELNENF